MKVDDVPGTMATTAADRRPPSMRLRRHPERGVDAVQERDALLAQAVVAHVGMVVDGWPLVIPMLFHHEGETVYVHGSTASRLLRHAASGEPLCITVTVLDGLVASRTAFNHSANYRSAVLTGHGVAVEDPESKRAVLERMTLRCFAGRAVDRDYSAATAKELRATTLVAMAIEAWSMKRRSGPPAGPGDDAANAPGLHWNGVLEPGPGGTVATRGPRRTS